MRTTLNIEDDVLLAAKELARRQGTTAGKVLSQLARRGLRSPETPARTKGKILHGVPMLPSRGEVVTLETVEKLMDQEGV